MKSSRNLTKKEIEIIYNDGKSIFASIRECPECGYTTLIYGDKLKIKCNNCKKGLLKIIAIEEENESI